MANAVHDACRAELDRERADLQESIDGLTAEGGGGDDAAETEALIDSVREAMTEIDDALAKLANGTFGTCELCSGTISDERLTSLPAARHCDDCADAQATVITASPDVD